MKEIWKGIGTDIIWWRRYIWKGIYLEEVYLEEVYFEEVYFYLKREVNGCEEKRVSYTFLIFFLVDNMYINVFTPPGSFQL